MKIYTKLGAMSDCHYTQENNVTEEIIKKDDAEDREKLRKTMVDLGMSKKVIEYILESMGGYLETCGPTALSTCIHAIGKMPVFNCPGGYIQKPENVITDCLNDPYSYPYLRQIRKETDPAKWLGNRIPQFYAYACHEVFGVTALFNWSKDLDYVYHSIRDNYAIMACMRDPGHFIPIVGYDDQTGNLIYHDPWSSNYYPKRLQGTPAFHRELYPSEWEANIEGYTIRIG